MFVFVCVFRSANTLFEIVDIGKRSAGGGELKIDADLCVFLDTNNTNTETLCSGRDDAQKVARLFG